MVSVDVLVTFQVESSPPPVILPVISAELMLSIYCHIYIYTGSLLFEVETGFLARSKENGDDECAVQSDLP